MTAENRQRPGAETQRHDRESSDERSSDSRTLPPEGDGSLYLYKNQCIDFDDVRTAILRLFDSGHTVTIHDGDGSLLFGRLQGFSCAGTVTAPWGATVATFAIDYIQKETDNGDMARHVLGVHIGPPGQWCATLENTGAFQDWIEQLSRSQNRPSS